MSNVFVDKNKIDLLANAISAKSGEPLTLTLDEMIEATDNIDTSGITPEGNIDITSAGVTNVTEYATATVPQGEVYVSGGHGFFTSAGVRKWQYTPNAQVYLDDSLGAEGFIADGYNEYGRQQTFNAVPKNTTITPTESAQTVGGANYMMEGAVTVNAISSSYIGSDIPQRDYSDLSVEGTSVTVPSGYYSVTEVKTVPTVNRHSATIAGTGTSSTCYVQYNSIKYYDDEDTFNFAVGETITIVADEIAVDGETVSSSSYNYTLPDSDIYIEMSTGGIAYIEVTELMIPYPTTSLAVVNPSTSTQTVFPADYNADYFYGVTVNAMPSGTEGTPTATKGTVSNHALSVTPSVTNSSGYISGGTHTGTAVSVSASELVSGSETKTENGTYDVTNLAELVVNVSGSSSMTIGTKTTTLSAESSSIQFTGLSGNPLSFVVTSSANQTTGGTKAVAVAYDGTSFHGMDITTQMEDDTGFTKSYSSGTLTITATSATFEANEYKLVYSYGGSSSDIHTANVQVGSGATSITFSGLSGRPLYFSCVFKSTFSTSSGYQRVIDVVNDGTNTYGHAMDSEAKAQTSWSYTYSGGSLTITSTGTNNGGYFHQPGYYQLTYAVDPNALSYQNKTGIGASTSSQTIYADSGYDALESVQINPVSQTNLVAGNIKSGTTISISNGSTNLWSVTGTYTGGGGGDSKNVQVLQSTSRTNSSSLTKVLGDLTVSKTGTYDIYWSGGRSNTSTSYTWGTRLYVDGTGYGTENTTWTNNCQSNHLSNVSLTANQKLSVYARGRTGSYYTFVPMLTIVET